MKTLVIEKREDTFLSEKEMLKSAAQKALEKAKKLEAQRIAEGWVNKRFPDKTVRLVKP